MSVDHKTEAVIITSWALVAALKDANKKFGVDRTDELKTVYEKCDDLEGALINLKTSSTSSLEMIIGSVELDDVGNKKINYFVKVTNGKTHVLYPWEALKETVMQWLTIENSDKKV